MSRRPRFYSGQLLTTDDLNRLVDHAEAELRRHHLLLHGVGIVRGLEVRPHTAPAQVVVTAGVAIDPIGRLLSLDADTIVPLSSAEATGTVVIGAIERLADPVPTPDGGIEHRSIETVVELRFVRRARGNFLPVGGIRRGAPVAR